MADRSTGGAWDLIVTPWHLDEHLPAFPIPANATEVVRPDLPSGPVPARMSVLHRAALDAVTTAARPLVLSGDCPTARASVAALQGRHRDLAVLWLDAHGDFNTPAISTSGYVGGMALAMLTGRTSGLFDDTLGLRPVPDANVVLADARDLDPAERDALTASQVRRVPADPAAIASALGRLGLPPRLPPPGHRRHRRRPAARRALSVRPRTLPRPDRGMPGRRLRHRQRHRRLHRQRLAPGARQRPDQPPDDHPPHRGARGRTGVARARRQLTVRLDSRALATRARRRQPGPSGWTRS